MSASLNRRAWIKRSTMLAGGTALFPSLINDLSAAPAHSIRRMNREVLTDAEFARLAPPALKARLFANENPFGPSDKAKKAIVDAMSISYQYPFQHEDELIQKIAAKEGVKEDMVQLGAGSTSLLYAAATYCSKTGGNIVSGDPTYANLMEVAEELGSKWIKVPLTSDYKLDLDAMEKAVNDSTHLVYICNPNNPTATTVDTNKLKSFCERVSEKTMVFVDEAYIDYLPDPKGTTIIGFANNNSNIVVARTFSKLHGFAGLRVGYMITNAKLIKDMEVYCIGRSGLSATSLKAAIASYGDTEFLSGALKKTMVSKEFLYKTLKDEGYEYVPSDTNFVLFPINMDGDRFLDEMFKRGVGVRRWKFNDKNWCRVSIGTMEEMKAFAEAFKQIS